MSFRYAMQRSMVELVRKIKEELESHLLVVRTQPQRMSNTPLAFRVSRSLAIIIRDWYAGLSDRTKNYKVGNRFQGSCLGSRFRS